MEIIGSLTDGDLGRWIGIFFVCTGTDKTDHDDVVDDNFSHQRSYSINVKKMSQLRRVNDIRHSSIKD